MAAPAGAATRRPDMTLMTEITSFGRKALATCDRRCEKAWGINGRSAPDTLIALDPEDDDDIVYLADGETGEAPRNPGTYEGGCAKPFHPDSHNRWCVRECERCELVEAGERIVVRDFSRRLYNQPSKHPDADHDTLTPVHCALGNVFRPGVPT